MEKLSKYNTNRKEKGETLVKQYLASSSGSGRRALFQGRKSAHQPCNQKYIASLSSLECVQMSHHLIDLKLIV
jgi:hypothetical protein